MSYLCGRNLSPSRDKILSLVPVAVAKKPAAFVAKYVVSINSHKNSDLAYE